jgi:uncharacterized delta-60 repeat protein
MHFMTDKLIVKIFGSLLIGFCGFLSTIHAAPGDLDTTFATTGFTREASNLGSDDFINATAIQSDGKIVAIGRVVYGGLVSCGISRYNADGTIDTSFDGDGKTIVQIGIEFNCNDAAIQSDGKIIVVGYVVIGSIRNFAVFRYNSDGSPDISFDGDGRKISAFVNGDFAYAVAIQTDGKIVVCGNIGDNFAAVRYNGNGSLDTSFDGDGWVTTDFNGGPDHSRAIAIQTDGKIVIAGNGRILGGSTNDFGVARYNTNGSLDTSFDGDGKVLTDIQGNNDNVQDILIQPDGKVVVGGYSWGNNNKFGLARYNADGSLDTSFDGDGKVVSAITTTELLNELAIQPDGKIIAAGTGAQGASPIVIARYNSDGSLDTSFDGDGTVVTFIVNPMCGANAVAIQPDGKIIAAGYSAADAFTGTYDFALARFNPNGSFDTSFDVDGSVISNIYNYRINANAIAVQPDGKIIAVGKTLPGNLDRSDFAVNRYNPDGTLDSTFDGDGRVITDFGYYNDAAYAVAVQPDGKIVVAGQAPTISTIARYNANGSLDTSFDGDGKLVEIGNFDYVYFYAMAIQADGKIIAAGKTLVGLEFASTLFRYNSNGSRDTSFDGDGKLVTDLGGNDEIDAIALQPDGKIIIAGRALVGASYDFMVGRYNSNGTLDGSFDGDGVAYVDFVGGYDYVDAVALQADGKIVVAGASSTDNNVQTSTSDSALARLNSNGSPDTSFDGDGKVRTALSNYFDLATGVAIQADGKIVTAGSSSSILNNDLGTLENNFALVRYNANGSLDSSYGAGGKAIIDLFTQDLVNDLALDSSGRAVVVGETDGYFTVARVLGGAAIPGLLTPFDFDGDDKSDISIFRPSNGQWWYQRSSDNQVLAFQFGNSTDRITPADYTGDGKTDIAIWRDSSGEWFVLRSEDNSFYSVPFGTTGDLPAPADFDADGKADRTVFRPSSGIWYINKSSSGGTDIIHFGQNGDVPTVNDFDGDGKADIAIFRPSNGQWWLNRSTAGVFAATFGSATDKPVAGEYTSDGKADIAFWRPSTGEWFVLRSENLSYFSVPFGANGDTPAPGDYDGDGKFDTAVFRPSNQTWYINRTTSGLLIKQFGLAGDKPVPSAFVP